MITLITPTGGRPESFALCEYYMSRQTVKFDQWIVVDDYPEPTKCTMNQEIIRPLPYWKDGDMTLPRNILCALANVRGNHIFIIEDDDWYHPQYLEIGMSRFLRYDLIGEGCARYYNVANNRAMIHTNKQHASLCQTAFTTRIIQDVKNTVISNIGEKFLDLKLWKMPVSKKVYTGGMLSSVGIKGMRGRDGIGYGHKDTMGSLDESPFYKLRQWIGVEDCKTYENMCDYSVRS